MVGRVASDGLQRRGPVIEEAGNLSDDSNRTVFDCVDRTDAVPTRLAPTDGDRYEGPQDD